MMRAVVYFYGDTGRSGKFLAELERDKDGVFSAIVQVVASEEVAGKGSGRCNATPFQRGFRAGGCASHFAPLGATESFSGFGASC